MRCVLPRADLHARLPVMKCLCRIFYGLTVALLLFASIQTLRSPVHASEVRVDLELVLAVDVSLSMDLDELKLQRQGYLAAFRHPSVIAAIRSGRLGRIAVTYLEWGGVGTGRMMVPWTLVSDVASAEAFAADLARAEIKQLHRTSISDIIVRASQLFEINGFRGDRRVIDISGDGPNNHGPLVTAARDAATRAGITINGLPILLKAGERPSWFDTGLLDSYYEDCVIGGHGAFIVSVRKRSEFIEAIRRKLILEIAQIRTRVWQAQMRRVAARSDCLIGEKLWNGWLESPTR